MGRRKAVDLRDAMGIKTRRNLAPKPPRVPNPLTEHSNRVLKLLKTAPIPCQEFNPGVVNRLLKEPNIEIVDLPSPYANGRGRTVQHLRLKEEPAK